MTRPAASSPAVLRLTEAVPLGSQAMPSCRMYCTRTGLPRCCDSTAASAVASLVVTAVAAGAVHPDRPHLLARQAEQFGDAFRRVVRLLRRGVERAFAVADVRDRAGRAGRRMRLRGELIFPFDDPRGLLDALVEIAVLQLDVALDDGRLTDVLVQ